VLTKKHICSPKAGPNQARAGAAGRRQERALDHGAHAVSRELVRPYKLPNTQAGLREAMGLVDKLSLEHAPKLVILGHEPTGVYHEPWARGPAELPAPSTKGAGSARV
jgi:hypothetical protein